MGAFQSPRISAADRTAQSGRASRGASPYPSSQSSEAQPLAVGAPAKCALRRGRTDRMALGVRTLARHPRRAQPNPGRGPGDKRVVLEKPTRVLSYRLRAYATRLLVLEI